MDETPGESNDTTSQQSDPAVIQNVATVMSELCLQTVELELSTSLSSEVIV